MWWLEISKSSRLNYCRNYKKSWKQTAGWKYQKALDGIDVVKILFTKNKKLLVGGIQLESSLCFVLDMMRLSEVLGFRCFLLVFSTSLVLFFLWRRWTSPLLSLIMSQRVIWKIKTIFFSRKIYRQFHHLCPPCLFPFPPPATTHLRRCASSVLRGQILRWLGSAIADCSRLLHVAYSHLLYTTTIVAIICRRCSNKR